MASLLPSEVARLVLGYVEENKCEKTSEKLQEELPVLVECAQQRRKGRRVPLRVGSQTLEDMLADYSASKDYVLESVQKNPCTLTQVPRSGTLLDQIKVLVSIIISNKDAIKQNKTTLGPLNSVRQRPRMVKLQNDLRMRTRNAQCHPSQQPEDQISVTPAEGLPGSPHRESGYVEHPVDHCGERNRLRSHNHPSSSLPSASQSAHSHHDVEEARQDSLGGDSTSMSLMQDLDASHQRRKGIVKRRSHGAEQTPVKINPVLDNEANFEKILKNLYENTALHEKIAENINRGLSTQCKLGQAPGEGDGDNSLSLSSTKKGKDNSSSSMGDGKERNCGPGEQMPGTSVGGDVAFLKEFDHIVTGIISETTSDPVFESFIDEVFGCSSPQSGISKGDDGSVGFSQGSSQEHSSGPSRLLSTPVPPPPPSSTPSSHSLLHISQTLPPHPSSVSPVMCHQSPSHNLSTPHIHMSPVNDTSPCLSPTSETHVTHTPMSSFSSASHPISSMCKPFPELSSPKKMDVWTSRNLLHENSQVTKDKTQNSGSLRDAMQESLQNPPLDNMREDMSSSWSSSVRLEAGNPSLTKHTNATSSMSCNQESPSLGESSEGSKTTPISPPTTRLSRRKKSKRSYSTKSKEDENNLGEQLLKEFADFQSSRSDKVDGCEESGNFKSNDKSATPNEAGLQSTGLPTEKGKIKDQEDNSNLDKVPCKESTPTTQPRQETEIVGLKNTNIDQAVVANVGSEDAHPEDENHIDTGQVEIEMETQTYVESEAEPALNSEALAVSIYHSDSKLEGMNKEVHYNGESHTFELNSAHTPQVRSNTIPGLVTSVSSSEENTYTITELAPAAPMDLTSLVSSLCSVDGFDISYSIPPHTSAASWSPQTPSSSSVVQSANVWGPTEVAPHGLIQEDIDSQRKEGNQPQELTIYLPPVSNKKEADEQLVTLVNGSDMKSMNLPIFTASLPHSSTTNSLTKSEWKLHAKSANPRRPLCAIAPRMSSSIPPSQCHRDGNDKVCRSTTYTLANNVTFTVPGLVTTVDSPKGKGAKGKRSRKTSPKKEAKKTLPKKIGSKKTTTKKVDSYKTAKEEIRPEETAAEVVGPKKSATKKAKETKTKKGKKTTPKKRQPQRKAKNKSKAKKPSGRSKKSSNQKKEAEEDMMDNNIIAAALSFALNSVTPKKDESLPMEPPTQETLCDAVLATGTEAERIEEVNAELDLVPTQEAGSSDPSLSVMEEVSGDPIFSGTGQVNSDPNAMATTTSDSQCSSGEAGYSLKNSGNEVVQASSKEHAPDNSSPCTISKQKQVSRKFNSGRSPQLKALLELSRSISPSKRALALKKASQSEESPCVRILHMRGSQSTPSRKNSHIRVLDFSTPQKLRASTRSPPKAVANLKFSPPAGQRSPRKASHIVLRKVSEYPTAKSGTLKIIVEEENAVTETVYKENAISDMGVVKGRKSSPRKSLPSSSWSSFKVGQRSNDSRSVTKHRDSRRTSMSSLSEFEFLDPKQSSLLLTEDEENIVLHLDGEDSMSSCGKSPPTDSGSIELFDLPQEDSSQGLNFSIITKDPNSDCIEDELPNLMGSFESSDILKHSGAISKQMETPSKAAEAISSMSMTPVCLEPPTPLLPSEQRSNSNTCDDLNTPIPLVVPSMTRTPLIKDYPQGPYSNSSVCSSYYMPSERSVTESEDSPNKLDTLGENAQNEEVDSSAPVSENDSELNNTVKYNSSVRSSTLNTGTGHGAENTVTKSTPKRSPAKLSGKEMGEMIEQEMFRLFSGQESSSPTKEANQADTLNSKCSGKSDSNSRDSSKGKQGKKRRVPSMKYQILVDSTCSEDEIDLTSDNRLPCVHSNKRSNEMPATRLKLKKSTRDHNGKADEKEVEKTKKSLRETQREKPTSDLEGMECMMSKAPRKIIISEMENTDDSMTRTPWKEITSVSRKTENSMTKNSRRKLTLESEDTENSKTETQREKITSEVEKTESNKTETPRKRLSSESDETESSKTKTPGKRLSFESEKTESTTTEIPGERLSTESEETESSKTKTPRRRLSSESETESNKTKIPRRLSSESEEIHSGKAEIPRKRLSLELEDTESSKTETPRKRLSLELENAESSKTETPRKRLSLESEKMESSKTETVRNRLSLASEKAESSKTETPRKTMPLESEKTESSKMKTLKKKLTLESEKTGIKMTKIPKKRVALPSDVCQNIDVAEGKRAFYNDKSSPTLSGKKLGTEGALLSSRKPNASSPSDDLSQSSGKEGSSHPKTKEKEEVIERNSLTKPLAMAQTENVTSEVQCEGRRKVILTVEDVFGSDVSSSDDSNLESPAKKRKDSESGDSFSSKLFTPVESDVHEVETENRTTLRRSQRSARNRGVEKFQAAPVWPVSKRPRAGRRGRGNGRQVASRGRGRRGAIVHVEEVVIEAVIGTDALSSVSKTADESQVTDEPTVNRGVGARRPRGRRASERSRTLTHSPDYLDQGAQKEYEEHSSASVCISDSPALPEASDKSRETKEHGAASEKDTNRKDKGDEAFELQQNEIHEMQENEFHELQQNESRELKQNEIHAPPQNKAHEPQQSKAQGPQQNEDHELQQLEDHESPQTEDHELQQLENHESPQTEDHELPQTEDSELQQTEDQKSPQNEVKELQQPVQKPFSSWGEGMKTPRLATLRNHTATKARNLRILWSNKLKVCGASVNVKTTHVGNHSTKEQASKSSSQVHQLPKEDNTSHAEDKEEKEKQCESTPQPTQPQNKATPRNENKKEQLPTCTSQPSMPQKEKKVKSDKEQLCESILQSHKTQKNITKQARNEEVKEQSSASDDQASQLRKKSDTPDGGEDIKKQLSESHNQATQLKRKGNIRGEGEEMMKQSSMSTNQASQLKGKSNTPDGGGMMKQSSASSYQASHPKRKSSIQQEEERGMKKLNPSTSQASQLKKKSNAPDERREGMNEKKSPFTCQAPQPRMKSNTSNEGEEGAEEKRSLSTSLASQHKKKSNTPNEGEEGTREKLSSSTHQASQPEKSNFKSTASHVQKESRKEKPHPSMPRPLQPQRKRETQKSPQSQGCARTIIFMGPTPSISLHRIQEMGDLGQVVNVTARLHNKEKRKSPKVPPADQKSTAGPSSRQKSTSKSTPEASVGQKGISRPSLGKRSLISNSSHERDSAGPQESPLPISLAPDSRTGMAKVDAGSSRSNISASSPQLSLQARLRQTDESRSLKSVQYVKGRGITPASPERERIASANRSSILSPSNPHESEKTSEAHKQSCSDIAKTSSENLVTENDVPDALPSERSSPVMTVAYQSDAEETSEEHCLMSYTALPATPEKKVRRICHSIVKEGKAMVAFPSPSKPHPLPRLTLPQRSLFNKNLKDHMGTAASAEQPESLGSISCSLQSTSSGGNEVGQRAGGMFDDHSQLNFSNKTVLIDATEDLNQGERETTECNMLRDNKETISSNSIGDDQHSPQNEEGSRNLSIPQGMGNDQTPTDLRDFTYLHQEDYVMYGSKICEQFRENDYGKMEEEEDSDVLRIEEHSENENDDVEVVTRINLRLSNMIEILSLNVEHEDEMEGEQHTSSPPTTKQKREEKSPLSTRRKTQAQCTQKAPTRCYITPATPKRAIDRKRRSSGVTSGLYTSMEDPEGRTEVERTSSTTSMQSLTSHKFQSPTEEYETPLRPQRMVQEAGCNAGWSQPVERKEEHRTSTEKRRRITPIRIGDVERHVKSSTGSYAGRSRSAERGEEWHSSIRERRRITPIKIGDVEQHVRASKGSWGKPGTPKEPHWGQSRGSAGAHWEMMEGRVGTWGQHERLGGGRGGLSERSVSSLSSISPGRLLISESPRGPDSSPAALSEFATPINHTTPSSPQTTAPSTTTPTKIRPVIAPTSPLSNTASWVSLDNPRPERQQTDSHTYIIESETSREVEGDNFLGRQRKARHMTQELHRGGILEIARSPDKQLAIMTSHLQEGVNLHMSEESLPSLPRTPPTPGKHLFIPPPPSLAGAFSNTSSSISSSSSSHSQARQDHVNLPLKKRKELVSIPDQEKSLELSKDSNI